MSRLKSKQILFAGQAPVHFLCFRPLYERLRPARTFPGPGGKWQISTSGGLMPTWVLKKEGFFTDFSTTPSSYKKSARGGPNSDPHCLFR